MKNKEFFYFKLKSKKMSISWNVGKNYLLTKEWNFHSDFFIINKKTKELQIKLQENKSIYYKELFLRSKLSLMPTEIEKGYKVNLFFSIEFYDNNNKIIEIVNTKKLSINFDKNDFLFTEQLLTNIFEINENVAYLKIRYELDSPVVFTFCIVDFELIYIENKQKEDNKIFLNYAKNQDDFLQYPVGTIIITNDDRNPPFEYGNWEKLKSEIVISPSILNLKKDFSDNENKDDVREVKHPKKMDAALDALFDLQNKAFAHPKNDEIQGESLSQAVNPYNSIWIESNKNEVTIVKMLKVFWKRIS